MDDLDELNKKVLLLAVYKKEADESLKDILKKLENGRVFTCSEGKKYLKELKEAKLIIGENLSFTGEMFAKSAEAEFRI